MTTRWLAETQPPSVAVPVKHRLCSIPVCVSPKPSKRPESCVFEPACVTRHGRIFSSAAREAHTWPTLGARSLPMRTSSLGMGVPLDRFRSKASFCVGRLG
jgi:hypothetical protein